VTQTTTVREANDPPQEQVDSTWFGEGLRMTRSAASGLVFGVTQVGQTVTSLVGAVAPDVGLVRSSLNQVITLTAQGATVSAQVAGEAVIALLTSTAQAVNKAPSVLAGTADVLAGDPSSGQITQARRIATSLLPIVGQVQAIGEAREKFRSLSTLESPEAKAKALLEARQECLMACFMLSLDVATLGFSGHIDKALKVTSLAVGALANAKYVTRVTSMVPGVRMAPNLDVLAPVLSKALEFEPLRDAMDLILAQGGSEISD
jgi:hypothetical protein